MVWESWRTLVRYEPVLAVCGRSGAGKTTLLEQVIPRLRKSGLRVGLFKHDVHGIVVDPPGKDSARLFVAGADVTLGGPGETLTRLHERAWRDLPETLGRLLADNDLVLVEGRASTPLPKVWLASEAEPDPPEAVEEILEVYPRGEGRVERFLALVERWLEDTWARRPVLGGVLVGGAAERMGRPKQLLKHGGRTLLEGVAAALQPKVDRLVLLGDGPVPGCLGALDRLADVDDVQGPLAGMLAAQRWAPRATWVVAACDLPLISVEAVEWLLGQRAPGRWAVVPRVNGGRLEPLLAVYEPQARVLLERLAARGMSAPRHIAEDRSVVCPEPPPRLTRAWLNVNTPEELTELARTSHHLATAALDMPRSATFSRIGLLDVLRSTPPRPSGRKHPISRHLAGLATRRGEKYGLDRSTAEDGGSPGPAVENGALDELREAVRRHLGREEALLAPPKAPSSLWAHSLRVARLARRLARETTGAEPEEAFLAGMLHDAGKFEGGRYHEGDVPEEERSAAWALEVLPAHGFGEETSARVAAGIRGVHRQEGEPNLLAAVVQDADNLDKLGPHGVATFLVKAGLRGRGLDEDLLAQIGVELTYARYAEEAMRTEAGRSLAGPWARRTEELLLELIGSVREAGLFQPVVETLTFDGLDIVAIRPDRCRCSGTISCSVHGEDSVKCTMLRLDQVCSGCGDIRSVRFCCPRVGRGDG